MTLIIVALIGIVLIVLRARSVAKLRAESRKLYGTPTGGEFELLPNLDPAPLNQIRTLQTYVAGRADHEISEYELRLIVADLVRRQRRWKSAAQLLGVVTVLGTAWLLFLISQMIPDFPLVPGLIVVVLASCAAWSHNVSHTLGEAATDVRSYARLNELLV